MVSRERVLESLLELTGRSVARSRPELMAVALRCAMLLADAAGAAALVALGRRHQRFAMRRGMTLPDVTDHELSAGELTPTLLRSGQPVVVAEASAPERIGSEDRCLDLEPGPALFVPLRLRDHDNGYLAVYRRRGGRPFLAEEVQAITLLAAWTTMTLENLRLSESVEKLAVTDDLTQVYNFRFLKTALRREIKRAGRFKQDLSIIMIDVDNLKGYNDRNGHLRGSFLLREMARVLAQQVRSWDLVAKYGGDEFTVILPQTAEEGALVAAERLRVAVEEHTFPLTPRGSITISLGVASFPAAGHTANELIQFADRALYSAKQAGRNRVGVPLPKAA